jgi:uncharacterized protein Yka (UPF0111/DUF47 family)
MLFKRPAGVKEFVRSIDIKESHCDHLERQLVARIFQSDLDPFQKLQIKELVIMIGDLSDQADRVSRRIDIVSIKRRV